MILDLDVMISDFWKSALPKGASGYTIHDDEVKVELLEFTYGTYDIVKKPSLVASTTFSNGTDVQATQNISDTKSTTSSFKWSVTAGLKLGAKTSFKVGAPFIAEGKVEASIELSLAATVEQTTTETQSWSYSVNVPVPPHSTVVVDALVSMAEYSPNWRARMRLSGVSYITVAGSSGRKAVPIAAILASYPGVTIDGDVVNYEASGTFKGAQGLTVDVKTSQHPYEFDKIAAQVVTTA
jgi:hypothetical protein